MKERIAIFPGSFNPFTLGHLSIARRAALLFDRVIVAIGYNEQKGQRVELESRLQQVRQAVSGLDNVTAEAYEGLTVKFAAERGACCIVRGVRDTRDFEYERNIADVNRELSGIETVFLCSEPQLGFVSASIVRELEHNGVDVSKYLP